MTYASDLILEVSEDLQDQASGDTYARWSQADLLKYLNAGERQLVYFKPTAYVISKVYQLSEGISQSLPDGSSSFQDPSSNTLPQAIELVRVLRNMGGDGLVNGSKIYPVRPQDIEELLPDSHYIVPEIIPATSRSPVNTDSWWWEASCAISSGGGIIGDATNNQHYISTETYPIKSRAGDKYHVYCKAKPGDKDWLNITLAYFDINNTYTGSHSFYFDLDNHVVGTAGGLVTPLPEGEVLGFSSDYVYCHTVFTVVDYSTPTDKIVLTIISAEADQDSTFTGDGATVNTYIKDISWYKANIENYSFDPEKRTTFEVYPSVPSLSDFWIEAQYSAVPPEIEASGESYDVNINLGDEYREPLKNYMLYRAHRKDAANSMYAKQESVAYWNLFLTQIGRKDLIEKQYRGNYGNRD